MCSRNSSHIGTSKGQPFVLQSCPDLERERERERERKSVREVEVEGSLPDELGL